MVDSLSLGMHAVYAWNSINGEKEGGNKLCAKGSPLFVLRFRSLNISRCVQNSMWNGMHLGMHLSCHGFDNPLLVVDDEK